MSRIIDQIESDLIVAVKAHDSENATILRTIKSQINNAAIEARGELDDKQTLDVLRKEAKKRKEATTLYRQSHREELAAKEERELKIIEKYMPAGLSNEEVSAIIERAIAETGAKTMADMGKVMAAVNQEVQGRADGGEIAAQVKAKLNS